MDPRRRGDYQGVSELGGTLGRFWAPAAYGFLAMEWGAFGWLTIAAIVVVAAAGLHKSAHAGRRFLEQHVPADVLADARASDPDQVDVAVSQEPLPMEPDAPLPESTGDLHR